MEQAKKLMKGFCRVCPVCDGRACVGEIPGMGGVGTGSSFTANMEALAAIKLKMKVLTCSTIPSVHTTVLGKELAMPVLGAPLAGVPINMSKEISEEQYAMAVLQGCHRAGTIGCTGDGPQDYVYQAGFKAIKSVGGNGIPFIKPWEDKVLFKKVAEAAECNIDTLGIDIDSVGLCNVKIMGGSIPLRTRKQLAEMIEKIPFQVILKGIMGPEEARIAVDLGAAAIVVSNHGGRILDYTQGTAEVLPDIVAAVNGAIPVLADGGIRSGADVLKMLALGASAVLLGRPLAISVFNDLDHGAETYLHRIKNELIQAMVLTGCEKLSDISSAIITD